MVLSVFFSGIIPVIAENAKDEFVLIRNGAPAACIVVAKTPTKSAALGACELQYFIKKISGAELPIVADGKTTNGIRIYVGESPALRQLGYSANGFKTQEYVTSAKENSIVLFGKDTDDRGKLVYDMADPARISGLPSMWDSIGSLYAVYDFLERSCGVRFLTQTEGGTFCPKQRSLAIKVANLRRRPAFILRHLMYLPPARYDAYTALWQDPEKLKEWDALAYPKLHAQYRDARQYDIARSNFAALFLLRNRCGGDPYNCNHSFTGYYSRFWEKNPRCPKLFEGKHPEFFAQGYPVADKPPQLCYTNPGLIRQVAKDAADYYDGKKDGRALGCWQFQLPSPFPVEPMDNRAFCKCADCVKRLTNFQNSEGVFSTGTASNYFFNFVNEVCRELHKTHPDRSIITLAYATHARLPENVELDPGMNVQYCFVSSRTPYDLCQYGNDLKNLAVWAAEKKKSGRMLGLWLYGTFPKFNAVRGKFHCFPGFYAHTIGKQMKLFHNYGIYGMFSDGFGEAVEAYVTFRLANDPELNVDTLLDEYFTHLYGAAASPMKKLYERIEDTYCDPQTYSSKIKVFDLTDKNAGSSPAFDISGLNNVGLYVDQLIADKWKDRITRFADLRVNSIASDGSSGRELFRDDFSGGLAAAWSNDHNFITGKDGERTFIELPWNTKKAAAFHAFPSGSKGIRITWKHLAGGYDFYRQWHFLVASKATPDAISGYVFTYQRSGWTARPFMDILKVTDAVPGKKTGSVFKLYGNEKMKPGDWNPCPWKDGKPTSLEMDQAPVKNGWTQFQLDITPSKDGTRLQLWMKSDDNSQHIIGSQTIQMAWGILGTEERMAKFASLMAEAEQAASTPEEKRHVALFKKGVWEYMTAGAAQYRQRTMAPVPVLDVPGVPNANGQVEAVDWAKAKTIGPWFKNNSSDRSNRELAGKICHDAKFLYLELVDVCDPAKLATSPIVFPYDDWEIFISPRKGLPYWQYAISPAGQVAGIEYKEVNFIKTSTPLKKPAVKVVSATDASDKWTVRLAFPLAGMMDDKIKKGDKFFLNIIRVSEGLKIDSLTSFTTVHTTDRMAEATLQ